MILFIMKKKYQNEYFKRGQRSVTFVIRNIKPPTVRVYEVHTANILYIYLFGSILIW